MDKQASTEYNCKNSEYQRTHFDSQTRADIRRNLYELVPKITKQFLWTKDGSVLRIPKNLCDEYSDEDCLTFNYNREAMDVIEDVKDRGAYSTNNQTRFHTYYTVNFRNEIVIIYIFNFLKVNYVQNPVNYDLDFTK